MYEYNDRSFTSHSHFITILKLGWCSQSALRWQQIPSFSILPCPLMLQCRISVEWWFRHCHYFYLCVVAFCVDDTGYLHHLREVERVGWCGGALQGRQVAEIPLGMTSQFDNIKIGDAIGLSDWFVYLFTTYARFGSLGLWCSASFRFVCFFIFINFFQCFT